jgi:hypothetical protein
MKKNYMKKSYILMIAIVFASGCSSAPKPNNASTAPVAAPAVSQASPVSNLWKSVACSRDTDNRKLEVQPKGEGCSLTYVKFGKSKEAASSRFGKKHCEKVLAHIKKHLETSGFTCG